MSKKIKRDIAANSIIFEGDTKPIYPNKTLNAELFDNAITGSTAHINIIDTTLSTDTNTQYARFNIPIGNYTKENGDIFADGLEFVDWFNNLANQPSQFSGYQVVGGFDGTTYQTTNALEDVDIKLVNDGTSGNTSVITFLTDEVPQIYDNTTQKFKFNNLKIKDYCFLEVDYIINSEVIDASHTLKLKFLENDGSTIRIKEVNQQEVIGADTDINYIGFIPFTIDANLIENNGISGEAELCINAEADMEVKINNYTIYLNR